MKKNFWPLLAFFALAASALRILNLRTGFDADGLPLSGNLYGYLLPVTLAAAALVFVLLARSSPAQRDEPHSLTDCFDFSDTVTVLFAVLGAFGLMGYAVLSVLFSTGRLMALLGVWYLLCAVIFLYVIFQLRRGNDFVAACLVFPVCVLVLQLILTYRSCANDPTLGHTYIEILLVCALMLVLLEFAAFAFRSGMPQLFVPLCAVAIILCVCHFVECTGLPAKVFCVGFLLLLFSFCSAASFEKE